MSSRKAEKGREETKELGAQVLKGSSGWILKSPFMAMLMLHIRAVNREPKPCWRSDLGVDGDFNKEGSGCTN